MENSWFQDKNSQLDTSQELKKTIASLTHNKVKHINGVMVEETRQLKIPIKKPLSNMITHNIPTRLK